MWTQREDDHVIEMSERVTHHSACFGCGADNPNGLRVEMKIIDRSSVRGRFIVRPDLCGPPGIAHGGVMAAALDEAMSLLVHGLGTRNVTGELSVRLRSAARAGTEVTLEARFDEHEGTSSRVVVATAVDTATGRLLATGRAIIVADDRG